MSFRERVDVTDELGRPLLNREGDQRVLARPDRVVQGEIRIQLQPEFGDVGIDHRRRDVAIMHHLQNRPVIEQLVHLDDLRTGETFRCEVSIHLLETLAITARTSHVD